MSKVVIMTAGHESDKARKERLLAELRRAAAVRQTGYRERALKLFAHVCASCGRTFEGRRLRELTVHHRDGNYRNNPPDGSNWELLCLYCHDHEHDKELTASGDSAAEPDRGRSSPGLGNPFAGLDGLLPGAPD